MMQGNGDSSAKARLLAKISDDIERVGWSAISVFPTTDDPGVPFTYTIGLRDTHDHPELLVMGPLQPEVAHGVLASAIANIENGKRYEPGLHDDILSGPEGEDVFAMIRVVDEPGRPLNGARLYHQRDESALQIVWPDDQGRFPGEDGYDAERFPQPLATGKDD